MLLPLYQIDAFADRPFAGNPAAVCPLTQWLPDQLLQAIATENNLSETAYLVPAEPAGPDAPAWHLRWFTPAREVPLCGHATLASAFVLFDAFGVGAPDIRFHTRQSGTLIVRRDGDGLEMDFPVWPRREVPVDPAVAAALGATPTRLFDGEDMMAVFPARSDVAGLVPDLSAVAAVTERGLICTAPADPGLDGDADFVSRMFAPGAGIPEDPVTGSAHCMLMPYWADRLGRTTLVGRQISARSGRVGCRLAGDRVFLSGRCTHYLSGTIQV